MYCIVAREKIPNYHYLALCMYLLMEAGMEGKVSGQEVELVPVVDEIQQSG
jgi:hypothetical protein